jgi:hypothetical protein
MVRGTLDEPCKPSEDKLFKEFQLHTYLAYHDFHTYKPTNLTIYFCCNILIGAMSLRSWYRKLFPGHSVPSQLTMIGGVGILMGKNRVEE